MPRKQQSRTKAATKASKKKAHGKKTRTRKPGPDTLWTIPIQAGGTLPAGYQNLVAAPTDTIRFSNGAGFPVDIHYTVPPLADIINLAMGASSPAAGGSSSNQLNVTVNYWVVNHNNPNQKSGPYSVQFGNGPLLITITNDDTNPDPVTVPKNGLIQFYCDAQYSIHWTPPNVWTPEPGTLSQGTNVPPQKALAGANGQSLSYSIAPKSRLTHGGGTVKIGS